MRFFKGLVIAEIFALWVEFFYKFGVKYYPKGFLLAIPIYFIYLFGLHCIFGMYKEKRYLWIIGIVIGGVAGLLVEWFLVGNSPWDKPTVFQSGQFVFHGAYPRISSRPYACARSVTDSFILLFGDHFGDHIHRIFL